MAKKFKEEGVAAYAAKKPGRPLQPLNSKFVEKVVAIRKRDDYGSQKIHYVMKRDGFGVSQGQIQKILDLKGLTEPCVKRRGQRKYVRYWWPISNYLWHIDWTKYKGKWYFAVIDDCSRKIMSAGEFDEATTQKALLVIRQAILTHEVCPVVILSDKGAQFYANKKNKSGKRGISDFEKELTEFGIEFWTARRQHPQTNGKMEKWFDTMKKRFKKHPEETLQRFVAWYNEERIHHALSYKTPDEVYLERV